MHHALVPAALVPIALLSSACSGDPQTTQAEPQEAVAAEAGTVTSILNAGASAQIGAPDAAMKFLFDPLYDNHYGTLQPLDDALIERIVAGEAPYDNVTAVFVSHAHGDHFSARHVTRMLAAQPGLRLVAPTQAVERMRDADEWNPTFATRITALSLDNGEQAAQFDIDEARIEAFRSPHRGWPDRHADIHNITYRVSAKSGAQMVHRVMHLGDADPGAEFLEPHAEFLSSARSGLAIVPFWFLNQDEVDALIGSTLNAEKAVGMHVPVQEPGWLADSGREYFSGEGQQLTVPETDGD